MKSKDATELSEQIDRRLRRGDDRELGLVAPEIGFSEEFITRNRAATDAEAVVEAVHWVGSSRPQAQNHWPALILALVAQVEKLLEVEGVDRLPNVMASNPPEEVTHEGGRAINTLNFTTDVDGPSIKLRPIYNRALNVIRLTMLRAHPSSAPHATQSWPDYVPLIKMIGAMSPEERREFAERIWTMGVLDLPARSIANIKDRTARPFELVLSEMNTSVRGVRGGAILQGLAYGYLRADSPNLILESHNVNTGSSRAGMLGDVDGFRGGEPELAAEVKDIHLTAQNVMHQLGDFLEDIERAPNVTAVVICRDITDEARVMLDDHLRDGGRARGNAPDDAESVTVLTLRDLRKRVVVWDVPKQEEALRGMEYYLARIQKSDAAVTYLRQWLATRLTASRGI